MKLLKYKYTRYALFVVFLAICYVNVNGQTKNQFVVAQDGSGDFKTVQEAVTACGAFPAEIKRIFIKNGIYREKVLIDSFHANITMEGESKEKTIITCDDHAGQPGIGTFNSYTVKVLGDHITLNNLTIENSSGEVGQAVALHVEGDYFRASNCHILGNQDTLYAAGQKSRQYYSNCYISGTTDFIFGAATAVFEGCELHSKRNSYITAASTPEGNQFGYVFRNCNLTAKEGVTKVYLGRPWRAYANVVFLNCEMGAHIVPEGWHNWGKPEREKTAFYAEYNSTGAGANPANRVAWSHQLRKKEAKEYAYKKIYGYCTNWIFNPVEK